MDMEAAIKEDIKRKKNTSLIKNGRSTCLTV